MSDHGVVYEPKLDISIVTRDSQQPGVIYALYEDDWSDVGAVSGECFVTPNSVERIYYKDLYEAEEEHEDLPVAWVNDWEE